MALLIAVSINGLSKHLTSVSINGLVEISTIYGNGKMTNKARNTAGKFSAKSDTPRKVRSVNLTDSAWQWLARIAEEAGMSRNDYLEAMADGNTPIMETVETKPEIELDDSVSAALVNAEDAKKNVAFFGFTPDEALADAHFQINMLTSNYDELEDKYEALKHKDSVNSPLMETARAEIETLRGYLEINRKIIGSREQEILALKSSLAGKDEIIAEAAEQIERLESELASEKNKSSATTGTDLSAKTEAICKLVTPLVSTKHIKALKTEIRREMERE